MGPSSIKIISSQVQVKLSQPYPG